MPVIRKGFTLIELLIVVAIIAILAAIAVPNFLHAQIRAKVARVESDMRNLATAIEAYRTDNDDYPRAWGYAVFQELAPLSTPVQYISQIPLDYFKPWDICPSDIDKDTRCATPGSFLGSKENKYYDFIRFTGSNDSLNLLYWFLLSIGPDKDEEQAYWPAAWNHAYAVQIRNQTYDPTNGLTSDGDMYRFGPSDPRYGMN